MQNTPPKQIEQTNLEKFMHGLTELAKQYGNKDCLNPHGEGLDYDFLVHPNAAGEEAVFIALPFTADEIMGESEEVDIVPTHGESGTLH